jgi:hypothetical protein
MVTASLRQPALRGNADPRTTRIYCGAVAGLARISSRSEPLWSEIASTLSREVGRQGPDGLVLLAEADAVLGRLESAGEITSQLALAGYRHPDLLSLLERHPTLGHFKVAAAR